MQETNCFLVVNLNKSVLHRAKLRYFVFLLLVALLTLGTQDCRNPQLATNSEIHTRHDTILPLQVGAEQTALYFPLLKGKRLGLVVNHTSYIGDTHLVDSLRSEGMDVRLLFAPEHGLRGSADAGEKIKSGTDAKTGLPIISLYGKQRAPTAADLEQVDMLIFDMQDVGARFYTYLSTLREVMEACAIHKKPLIVLDRPNPNAHVIDGPVLKSDQKSFVGAVPVPIAHGCTLGELALMILGENWIKNAEHLELRVIPCARYTHNTRFSIRIPPSPNLRSDRAIRLYPTLCLFEGTEISVGRGTDTPFEVAGSPLSKKWGTFQFTPTPKPGAQEPPHKNKTCYGISFLEMDDEQIAADFGHINWETLIDAYATYADTKRFFLENRFFDKLSGDIRIRKAIEAGGSAEQIRALYRDELTAYQSLRSKYLLYE